MSCKYCEKKEDLDNNNRLKSLDISSTEVFVDGHGYLSVYDGDIDCHAKIYFCPMCGARLRWEDRL